MLLFWRIRYLDSRDGTFKDRDLWLETDTLDPVERAAVEYLAKLEDFAHQREWLRYRYLFREQKSGDELNALCKRHDKMRFIFLTDYFEDEHGQELSPKRMAEILTGDPNAIMFPAGVGQHDIDCALADRRPIPTDRIKLSADDLHILGYFTRDLRELLSSAFYKEGPGALTICGNVGPELHTAVTDEEIRSFATIFRRLYMKNEPAAFLKAVKVFASVTRGYPLGKWIAGVGEVYERELCRPPSLVPYAGQGNFPFARKRLIDVFLYTQYAHQPNEKRARQFQECLAAVGGRQAVLTWLFLSAMWECSLHMHNAGVIIANFFDHYRQIHSVACDILMSVVHENPGIGKLEKKEDRNRRLFEEAVKRLAVQLWEEAGRPKGERRQFEDEARAQLSAAVPGKIDVRGEVV